jgi:hypothetical protein
MAIGSMPLVGLHAEMPNVDWRTRGGLDSARRASLRPVPFVGVTATELRLSRQSDDVDASYAPCPPT